jgi:RimJ/RimL family protein N-acetyltransferase
MKIKYKSVSLIPIEDCHIPILFTWRNQLSFLNNCTSRIETKSIDNFEKELLRDFEKDRHRQFIIEIGQGNFVGTIYSYNELDKFCFVTIFIKESKQNIGFGFIAFILFNYWLFNEFELFKTYSDIYDYNFASKNLFEKQKASHEGKFLGQKLFQGKRFDVNRYAVYAKNVDEWVEKLSHKIKIEN